MIRLTIFTSCLVAAGCFVGTDGKERVLLMSTKHVDGGAACPTGGNTVSTGPDDNGNGVLDDAEVSSTVSLCDAETVFQSGVVAGDYLLTPSWSLDKGTGDRSFDFEVTFPTPFIRPPTVVVGLSDLDAARVRVKIEATSITATGFNLHIFTWSDTLLYGVHANWFAYAR